MGQKVVTKLHRPIQIPFWQDFPQIGNFAGPLIKLTYKTYLYSIEKVMLLCFLDVVGVLIY